MNEEAVRLINALRNTPYHRADLRKKYAEQLIAAEPTLALGWNQLASAISAQEGFSAARSVSRTVLERFPEDVQALYNYALSFFNEGGDAYLPALLLLKEVVKRDPFHLSALYWIGEIYQINWESEKAIPWFRQCVQFDPTFSAASSRLAVAYARCGDFHLARTLAKHSIELDAGNPTTLCNAGMAFLYIGDLEIAEELFLASLAINPLDSYCVKQLESCRREIPDKQQRLKKGMSYKPLGVRLKGSHRFFNEENLNEQQFELIKSI
jgi:tetratricopeptide (TPR) repeat protein